MEVEDDRFERIEDLHQHVERAPPRPDEIVGSLILLLDITRERQLERELQRAQRLELVGRMASGIAHDFNNLLGVVLNLADLARLWETLERGPCRCIVLTGAGERAFSAGADVSGDLSADLWAALAGKEKIAVVGSTFTLTLSGNQSQRIGKVEGMSLAKFQHRGLLFSESARNVLGLDYWLRYSVTFRRLSELGRRTAAETSALLP